MIRWRWVAAAVLLVAVGVGTLRFVGEGSAERMTARDLRSTPFAPEVARSQALDAGVTARDAGPELRPRSRRIAWRRSLAVGSTSAGRLISGVQLPASGPDWFTWDPILERSPGRHWRRWGTDLLIRRLLRVVRAHRRSNPSAPRVTVGDISRPRGGDFGPRYGLPGHASHQNGLDVDVYYPRLDRAELRPETPAQVDRELAQDLVDRFVAAGAEFVFVGPSLGLTGPPQVVQALANHDDHLHARFHPR